MDNLDEVKKVVLAELEKLHAEGAEVRGVTITKLTQEVGETAGYIEHAKNGKIELVIQLYNEKDNQVRV